MKLLLLDFGGVVLRTPFELRHLAEPSLGPLEWAGPFDVPNDPQWGRFMVGEITERQYWAARAARYDLDTKSFMRQFFEPAGPHLIRPEMVMLVDEYRSHGGRVGVLTNDLQAFHGKRWADELEVLDHFDFIVDGSVTGVLKPAPEAFGFALAEFGDPDPANVVFVDDLPVNLTGAKAVGLTTIWFDPTDVATSVSAITAALTISAEPT